MKNLQKAAVYFTMALFLVGLVALVPMVPLASTGPLAAPAESPTAEIVDNWVDYINTYSPETVLDSRLASFRDSGFIGKDVSLNAEGNPSTMIVIRSDADVSGLRSLVNVDWMVNMGVATIVKAHVDRASLKTLETYKGVVNVYADVLEKARVDGFETRPVSDSAPPVDATDMYVTKGIIGAEQVDDTYGFDGAGSVVGITDTGVDFSNPDLKDAMYFDAYSGMPGSFDPSGLGEISMLYRVNTTNVVNVTAWFAYSSWNLLSYESGGKYYINGSSWDPRVNNQGGLSNLNWFITAYLSNWWDDEYPNQGNLTEFYTNIMRQDLEIPAPNLASGGATVKIMDNTTSRHNTTIPFYSTGYIFQQRWNPYVKVFAPVLGLNATHMVVDWNTTNAHTQFWNLAINYGELDFNVTADRDYIEDLGDWSFVDDYEAGYWYSPEKEFNLGNRDHMVLSFDYTGDSVADFGLGALAHVWDPIFGTGIIDGMSLGGRLGGLIYDTDAHGTFVAGEIAGRGVLEYPIGLNGTMERLYGVANGSTIIGVPAIGTGSHFGADLWSAGFDFNYTSGYWEWNPLSNHSCVVSSNSWGWVGTDTMFIELLPLYAMMYTTISTPGYFDAAYPGILFAFSSGNSGPSFGSASPPNAPQILTVGGSTSYHTFQDTYGPGQGYDQIYESGSRGPTLTGYPKPDVVAPGRNVYGLQPGEGFFLTSVHDGEVYPSAIYAGTSMACPHVAGSVAIMLEAAKAYSWADIRPDEIKTIIQNTAFDLGLDALSQGFGRINVFAAVEYIAGAGSAVVFSNTDGAMNYAATVAEAWDEWMRPYDGDAFMNTTYPTSFADGSLYYGIVSPGDKVNISMAARDETGTAKAVGDFTWTSQEFEASAVYTYVWETYEYNETTAWGHNTLRDGWFELDAEMSGPEWTAFSGATYATILIGGEADLSLGAWIMSWNDNDPANGIVDYYNTSTEAGDELTRYGYAGDGHDLKLDVSCAATIASLFTGETPIVIIDDGDNAHNYELNVTIIVWTLGGDNNEIDFGDNVADSEIWANLTVPAGADPGVHQGYVFADSQRIPYTYFVQYDVVNSNGEENIVASGYGDVLTPYEHGVAMSMEDSYYTDGSGDRKTFRIHVSNTSAMYLGAKIVWTADETYFDISIGDVYSNTLATSYDANKTSYLSAAAIADMDGETDFYVFVYAHDLWHELPCNFTLIVMAWEALPAPTLAFNWYSADAPARTSITTGGVAEGDHVVMNATWTDATLTNMPDYDITTLELKILYGTLVQRSGTLLIPNAAYNPFDGAPLHLDEFSWEVIPGISAGDNVRIRVGFTNGDCDIFMYWTDTDNSTWTSGTDLAAGAMGTGANPEVYTFTATRDGSLSIGVFNFDGNDGTYSMSVDNRAGLEPARVFGNTFEMDTYGLGANASYALLVHSQTGTNIDYSIEIPGVTINNFFKPYLENLTVDDTTAQVFIDWDMFDLNAGDTHTYEVLLSSDSGATYQLVAAGLTATNYTWDSTGFLIRNYMIQIRVTDSYGLTDSAESGAFEAGTVTPPTSSTGGTTTTTTVPPPLIDPLWIGLIGGIGVGVVVVLILFLVKKK